MKVACILSFAGIDTSVTGIATSVGRSPFGINSDVPGLVLGAVDDITTNNDHTSDFFLAQSYSVGVVSYTMWQNPSINNTGKELVATFYLP